jgi:hypothetical protein
MRMLTARGRRLREGGGQQSEVHTTPTSTTHTQHTPPLLTARAIVSHTHSPTTAKQHKTQEVLYAMQRMADDLPLSHYHVPPVSEFLFSVCGCASACEPLQAALRAVAVLRCAAARAHTTKKAPPTRTHHRTPHTPITKNTKKNRAARCWSRSSAPSWRAACPTPRRRTGTKKAREREEEGERGGEGVASVAAGVCCGGMLSMMMLTAKTTTRE